jgi:apolipoprotein N-acyltransferase
MTKNNYSYIYLLIGFVFLFIFNGRWILPIAAFIAPLFLIRFLRFQKPFIGLLFLVLAGWISNIFIWKGMMPMSGFFYYFLMFMMSLFTALTFLIDRVYSQKLKGIISTLIFPSAYVFMEFIVVSTNPSGSYGTLAHTQTSLPLLQIISVTGIWGVVFIITWTS